MNRYFNHSLFDPPVRSTMNWNLIRNNPTKPRVDGEERRSKKRCEKRSYITSHSKMNH